MKKLSLYMICLLAAIFTSCNHKDLCYEHIHNSKLTIVYDWRDAPDATAKGMCVFFYSMDNADEYYRFDFSNTHGGEIEIPKGRYRLITYNNDTEIVRFNATNIYEGNIATTRPADILEPLYGNGTSSNMHTDDGEDVMITPDGLWGCHAEEVIISDHGVECTFTPYDGRSRAEANSSVDSDGNQTITLYPHDMLCHYSYEVRNVENVSHISKVSAALSGMSGSLSLYDEMLDDTPVTLPVGGSSETDSNRITGKFLTFGHNPANHAAHKMTFFVVMDDGSKYVIKNQDNLDVTTQVDNAPDRRHVHIIIDGLKLPTTSNPDQGWDPTVDDWGVVHEDIEI